MYKLLILVLAFFLVEGLYAQLVDIQEDYNGVGDCVFSATNYTDAPLFLHINFTDLQNTSFNETLPYVKRLEAGTNSLFTLERYMDGGTPQFNYQRKIYRSNPTTIVNLDFPYLLPFQAGKKVPAMEVKNIEGFWGAEELKSWLATGFKISQGEKIYASRQGIIVEVSGAEKEGEPQEWYHAWNNSVTILQPDGTLICYRNVVDKNKKLQVNEKIHAGEELGEIAPGANELILLVYQNTLSSDDLRFIIPQFAVNEKDIEIINPAKEYEAVHPVSVRGLEMSKKEKRKIFGKK